MLLETGDLVVAEFETACGGVWDVVTSAEVRRLLAGCEIGESCGLSTQPAARVMFRAGGDHQVLDVIQRLYALCQELCRRVTVPKSLGHVDDRYAKTVE